MRMKFFEKTYLMTLTLFLFFLNLSIISLCLFTFNSNIETTQNACISEENAVREAFENDMESLNTDGIYLLQVGYGSFYSEKGIYLHFERDGVEMFSNMPDGISPSDTGTVSSVRYDGKNYMMVSENIADGKYTMTYVKDVSYLYDEFFSLAVFFIAASVIASVALAILLYFVLRKLYSPLEKLRKATSDISRGDFSARADESGNDELSALAKDFNSMSDKISEQIKELEATAEQKQRMLDDLAHEMRTPLTGIHGYAEYIKNANISDDERIDAIDYIMKEAMRLKSISEILLDTAFIRENKIEKAPVSANELLIDTKSRAEMLPGAKDVEINALDTDITVECNKTLVELLLSNLTENAIKACRNGGKVELSAYELDSSAVICVKDSGVGMTKEQLAHITEPFYRTDKARSRKEGGTGLGLALCDTIAKAHGAELSFESRVGKGTKAMINLKKITDPLQIQDDFITITN